MFQKLFCRGSWSRPGSLACWKIQKSRCLIILKCNFCLKMAFFRTKKFSKVDLQRFLNHEYRCVPAVISITMYAARRR